MANLKRKSMTPEIIIEYALYDGRYLTDEDSAIVYEICTTLKEARRNKKHYGDDTVIVECKVVRQPDGKLLITEEKIVS